ncbi:MAG: hypothetical protein N2Z21_04240 [Candidatus Sumerlaeaceae bacterium]|nr:hypothetical protein [Candidatus Sumerlaeaceae bacterium]
MNRGCIVAVLLMLAWFAIAIIYVRGSAYRAKLHKAAVYATKSAELVRVFYLNEGRLPTGRVEVLEWIVGDDTKTTFEVVNYTSRTFCIRQKIDSKRELAFYFRLNESNILERVAPPKELLKGPK